MLKFTVYKFNLHKSCKYLSSMSRSLRVFVVEQFGHANKESTSDEMDKSLNLNHVGNIESFGSSLTQFHQLRLSKVLLHCPHLSKVD